MSDGLGGHNRGEPQTHSTKGNGVDILVGYERRDDDSKESDPSSLKGRAEDVAGKTRNSSRKEMVAGQASRRSMNLGAVVSLIVKFSMLASLSRSLIFAELVYSDSRF